MNDRTKDNFLEVKENSRYERISRFFASDENSWTFNNYYLFSTNLFFLSPHKIIRPFHKTSNQLSYSSIGTNAHVHIIFHVILMHLRVPRSTIRRETTTFPRDRDKNSSWELNFISKLKMNNLMNEINNFTIQPKFTFWRKNGKKIARRFG